MKPIRALLVDDEPLARRGIRQLLVSYPDVDVVGECRDGREALRALVTLGPDLVFLDIQMPGLSGLDVVRIHGPERMPATVFVTAHDQFAVQAFETRALDYLVKPLVEARFRATMTRVRERARMSNAVLLAERLAGLLADPALSGMPAPAAGVAPGRGAAACRVDPHRRADPRPDRDRLDRSAGLLRLDPRRRCPVPDSGVAGGARAAARPRPLRPDPSLGAGGAGPDPGMEAGPRRGRGARGASERRRAAGEPAPAGPGQGAASSGTRPIGLSAAHHRRAGPYRSRHRCDRSRRAA